MSGMFTLEHSDELKKAAYVSSYTQVHGARLLLEQKVMLGIADAQDTQDLARLILATSTALSPMDLAPRRLRGAKSAARRPIQS